MCQFCSANPSRSCVDCGKHVCVEKREQCSSCGGWICPECMTTKHGRACSSCVALVLEYSVSRARKTTKKYVSATS